jgi:hypothetical protein
VPGESLHHPTDFAHLLLGLKISTVSESTTDDLNPNLLEAVDRENMTEVVDRGSDPSVDVKVRVLFARLNRGLSWLVSSCPLVGMLMVDADVESPDTPALLLTLAEKLSEPVGVDLKSIVPVIDFDRLATDLPTTLVFSNEIGLPEDTAPADLRVELIVKTTVVDDNRLRLSYLTPAEYVGALRGTEAKKLVRLSTPEHANELRTEVLSRHNRTGERKAEERWDNTLYGGE